VIGRRKDIDEMFDHTLSGLNVRAAGALLIGGWEKASLVGLMMFYLPQTLL